MEKGRIQLVKNEKIINIMERTLDHVDARLIDHGKRVAYLLFKVLYPQNKFDDKQLRDICLLGLLHDVGAYKTEEIDDMVIFESIDVWEHATYGYLFLKHFSPLKDLAPVLLFHHAECEEVIHLENPTYQMLAQLVFLCDRADVYSLHDGDAEGFKEYLNNTRDVKYGSEVVDMFLDSGIDIGNVFENIDNDAEFNRVFRETPMTDEEVEGYVNMIVCSIDFRRRHTAIHTVASAIATLFLAEKLDITDENEISKLRTAAMLNDVGKVGIPFQILESTEKFDSNQLEAMRKHVDVTEKILDGSVDDEIMNIAIKHHEKLNGTGYPRRLGADSLNQNERILAVADIFCALCQSRTYRNAYTKEKVIVILEDMCTQNLLDEEIVSLAIHFYDELNEEIDNASFPTIQAYNGISEDYLKVREEIETKYQKRTKKFINL